METLEMILEAVNKVGFPIVISLVLFWYINKKDEQHKEEVKSLKDSLDRNSSILDELKGLITYLVGDFKK